MTIIIVAASTKVWIGTKMTLALDQLNLSISPLAKPAPKLRRPKRLPVLLPPLSLERQYLKRINRLLNRTKDILDQIVIQRLPEIVAENDFRTPNVRKDADVATLIRQLMRATRNAVEREITDFEIEREIEQIALETDQLNRRQIGRLFAAVIGVDLVASEPWLGEQIQNFVVENTNLIRNLQDDFLAQTQQVISSGVRRGLRHEEIAKRILSNVKDEEGFKSRFKTAKTRAQLIARDQVNKFNGNLSMLRQVNAGISQYVWRTVRDERVRQEHRLRDGQVFDWSNPPSDGHPGEPINCRCWPEPVFEGLV